MPSSTTANSQAFVNPFEADDPKRAFFSPKPPEISWFEWLFHPSNEFAFPAWVRILIHQIERLSRMQGWTIFKQPFICKKLAKSATWIRLILRRLEAVGVLETRRDHRDGRNRHRVNPRFWAVAFTKSVGPTFDAREENSAATSSSAMTCNESGNTEQVGNQGSQGKEPKSPSSPATKTDDGEIISTFEALSGLKYRPERDAKALADLLAIDPKAVIAGMYVTAFNRANSEHSLSPIRSLRYFLPQVEAIREEAAAAKVNLAEYARYAKAAFGKYFRRE